MKKSMIGMAAAAAVLFGMASCGHKAENTETTAPATETAADEEHICGDMLDEPVPNTDPAVGGPEAPEPGIAEESLIAEEIPQQVAAEKQAKDGYTTTASGLKYKVLKKGNGKKPKATDTVKVHYEGKLTNGQVFDSSYQRGEPATFPLNRVIPGWTEGVQLMPEGSVYEFYIPYNLAYGENGGGPIPPKSDLIFKVELIEVQ